ncbi:prolyl aminopeptidase [Limibacillus halophilus]|uniref:Proline iminopeptidase n=1 Tax=Limibacillus halophilus TaxID=1579333 RepID=A0A839SRI2_9PROT|nr:prolyl aminopeptidase [Limibacillus halophilus]MBB3063966.1 proline iminopeptidase [Limibacillus halophilus]
MRDANKVQQDLFPSIEPYDQGYMPVDTHHSIYWEVCGNPKGKPVIFLHGGPGAGCGPEHRRFFDPAHYRIVLFDQRGAGRSRPYAEIKDNTTQHLIADIELLRETLGIERWMVFGGSWGSTLALAYAQAQPARVSELVLRGIFLGRAPEIDWFLTGIQQIFPEAWADFTAPLEGAERSDILASYYRRLNDPDPAVHLPAARAWAQYEGRCVTLLPSADTVTAFASASKALALARLEAHYFINGIFLEPNQLLDRIGAIRDIPAVIVQGRYDIVCPATSAHDLKTAWPEARLEIIHDAGHSALEPGIRRALVGATESFKTRL